MRASLLRTGTRPGAWCLGGYSWWRGTALSGDLGRHGLSRGGVLLLGRGGVSGRLDQVSHDWWHVSSVTRFATRYVVPGSTAPCGGATIRGGLPGIGPLALLDSRTQASYGVYPMADSSAIASSLLRIV